MTDNATKDEQVTEASISKIKSKVDLDSPLTKRHVIKGKNVKTVTNSEKTKSSPLAKSFSLIGRFSKKGKAKNKNQLTLNESYERTASKLKQKVGGDEESGSVVIVVAHQTSPCSTSQLDTAESNTKSVTKPSNKDTAKETKKSKNKSKKKEGELQNSRKSKPVRSHTLTEYYPVRRSSRKSKAVLEKEFTDSIIEAIKKKSEEGLAVKEFKSKGRGIVAERAFNKGAFVVEYAGELIDWDEAKQRENEYEKDPTVGCYMYYFVHENNNYCIDATAESGRLGRLLNHSRKNPNCKTKLIPMPDTEEGKSRPRLIIIAKRDIGAGEELTYDYGDRDKETLQSHPWLKST